MEGSPPLAPLSLELPHGRKVIHADELAQRIGVPTQTVRDACRRKEIKASRVGRRYLIPLAEAARIILGVESPAAQSNAATVA